MEPKRARAAVLSHAGVRVHADLPLAGSACCAAGWLIGGSTEAFLPLSCKKLQMLALCDFMARVCCM